MYSVELSFIKKTFSNNSETLDVIKDVSMTAVPKETISIIGSSGSGKTTLLQIIGLIDAPTSGQIFLNGSNCSNLKEKQLLKVRRKFIGYMYQEHNLIKELTAIENIMIPLLIMGQKEKESKEQAMKLLSEIELENCKHKYPNQLSGGEKQRISLARAMIKKPLLMLADEPTGNLDENTSVKIFEIMRNLSELYNTTTIVITHNAELAKTMKTHYQLKQGRLKKL